MRPKLVGLATLCVFVLLTALSYGYLAEGDRAPDFAVEGLQHETIRLSDYSGRIVVLFLLAVSSNRCQLAAPAYEEKVYRAYKEKGVVVLGIDVDTAQDSFSDLAAFRQNFGITFPLALDVQGECWGKYRGDDQGNLPVFYVIDRLGIIEYIRLGYRAGREQYIIDAIEKILFEERPSIELRLDRQEGDLTPYVAGETMRLYASIRNPGTETEVIAYLAVAAGADLFFWPSYGTVPEGFELLLPAGFALNDYPVEAVTFNEAFPPGLYSWLAALVDPGTGEWVREPAEVIWFFGRHSHPQGDRASLEVPEQLWDLARCKVDREGLPLGIPQDQLRHFGGHEFRLKVLEPLYGDVAELARFSGEVADNLLASYARPGAIAAYCLGMVDYGQARGGTVRSSPTVSPCWQQDFVFETPQDEANWDALPDQVQDFIIAMVEAAATAGPDLESAFDRAFIAKSLGVSVDELGEVDRADFYDLVTEPWRAANRDAPAFEAMHRLDFDALSSATSTYLSSVAGAIESLRAWIATNQITASFEKIRFDSPAGEVCVCGTGSQRIERRYSLVVDLGGDDTYVGEQAVPCPFRHPVGAIVDLAGDDRYEAGQTAAGFCCGLFGIGALFDLSGNDRYTCGESGQASAWHGSGILIDWAGNDRYDASSYWCQAAAHAGFALLLDICGDDEYECLGQGQGFGSTLGIGVLLDLEGRDRYVATGVYSSFFGNNTALAQGAGFGRRADYGSDGRSLAGGIGALVDGAGDDYYWGPVYVQGTGYWWSLGMLEDRAGNDTYRCLQLSLGSGPHMALASAVDLLGNDRYNAGNFNSVGQYLGSARDGSVCVFIDASGDDYYGLRPRCAGSGDLQAVGLFWDRYGDDVYHAFFRPDYTCDQSCGCSTQTGLFGNFRDAMDTIGVFLDTQGDDNYDFSRLGGDPKSANNRQWHNQPGPRFFGYGLDVDWYLPAQRR